MNVRQVNIACIIILTSLSAACAGLRPVQSTGSAEAMRSQVHVGSHVLINTKNGDHYDIFVKALTATAVVGTSGVATTSTNPLGSYAKLPSDNRTMPGGFNLNLAEVEVPYEAIAVMKVDPPNALVDVPGQVGWAALVTAALAVAPFIIAEDSLEHFVKRQRNGGRVSLDDAYQAAYGVSVHSPAVDQETGRIIQPNPKGVNSKKIAGSELAFTYLEYRYGISASKYMLCEELQHQDDKSYLLLSVVRRKSGRSLSPYERPLNSQEWYLPNEKTDTVIDWVAIESTRIEDDKTYAYLLAAAVRAILDGKRAPDYWSVSKRWNDGELSEVMVLSERRARGTLLTNPSPRP